MSRLYLLGFLLTPALAGSLSCYPADRSLPATAHNHHTAKLTPRAKQAYTLEIISTKTHRYILVKQGGETKRYYYKHTSDTSILTYTNGRYILLHDIETNTYYIKHQPSPYTTRLICSDY